MDVAIVIPCCTRTDLLQQALEPLKEFSVFVVNDGELFIPESANVHVVKTSNPRSGFARAANLGLSKAQQEGFSWVLLLNDDAVISALDLHQMISLITPQTGAIGPVVWDANKVVTAGISVSFWGRIKNNHLQPEQSHVVDALSGACLLLPSWTRFDVRFPHGFEDIAMCIQLANMGLSSVVCATAKCFHHQGATLAQKSSEKIRHSLYGQALFFKKRRFFPLIVGLTVLQLLKERSSLSRFNGAYQGFRDVIYRNSMAVRMASSSPGSNNIK